MTGGKIRGTKDWKSTLVNSGLLTIVIPTRDRPDWLALCLRSIFEHQTVTVPVIVSDNSALQHSTVTALKSRYDFSYVRRSGKMSMTEHLNACFGLVSTPWMILLHDDDELCPNMLVKLGAFLAERGDVGIVVGGFQYIDSNGKVMGEVNPKFGIFRGEEGLISIGLPFHARSSNTILSVTKSREVGGFPDVRGLAADFPFACQLAHSYGVAFLPEVIGRYRTGHEQSISLSNRTYVEAFVESPSRTAELLRDLNCTASTAYKLMDAQTWAIFEWVVPRCIDSDPEFVFELCQKCLSLSPTIGPWQRVVRRKYPFLFLRPRWLAQVLFIVVQKLRYRLKRLTKWQLA
ncbi:MAG TPA: glycosyltransferase family A protein [Nitrospiraceae bacterium]|nr:glycosyltransferase family A protein [Nitrospiraceae bacterium]